MDFVYDPKYYFSNKIIDWNDYKKDVKLLTDAVWERQRLKVYFRTFFKVFYYNSNDQKNYISMLLHDNYNLPNNWKYKEFGGYNPTDKSMSYEKIIKSILIIHPSLRIRLVP